MNPKPNDWKSKLDWARFTLVNRHRFFSVVFLNLGLHETQAVPTMATDGHRILFNPDFVSSITREEVLGVLVHELLHVLGFHMTRRRGRNAYVWNIACDHVVNYQVRSFGFLLPAGAVEPIHDKTAEQIYDEYVSGGREVVGDQVLFGWVDDASADESGRAEVEGKIKVVAAQAANLARLAGEGLGNLSRLVDELTDPLIPWRDVLSRFVTEKASSDYTMLRPNRRFIHLGLILPSLGGQTVSKGAVSCDTSGSMDINQLREVCSEALSLSEMFVDDPELDVFWFDTAARHQRVADAKDLRPVGGGGTSFSCIFREMKAVGVEPPWMVVLTDGFCEDFGPDPGVPVLWILTKGRNPTFKPPFGEVAHYL